MEVSTIITLVITVLGTVAAGFWAKAHGKIRQIRTLVKEAADIIIVAVDALDDNQVTSDEIENLKLQVTEFKAALKALIGRE